MRRRSVFAIRSMSVVTVPALCAALLLSLSTKVTAREPMEAYACRQDIHPNDAQYPGVHVSTLVQAPNGDLLYAFYAGSREAADDVRTYGSRLAVGSHTWTAPTVIFDEPNKPDGNAVLGTDGSGNVYLLFSTIMGRLDGRHDADHLFGRLGSHVVVAQVRARAVGLAARHPSVSHD